MLPMRSMCTALMALFVGIQGPVAMTQPPPPPSLADITAVSVSVPASRQLGDGLALGETSETHVEVHVPSPPPPASSQPTGILTQSGSSPNYAQLLIVLLAPFNVTVAQIGTADAEILMATMIQIGANLTIVGEAVMLAQSPRWLAWSSQAILCGVRASPLCNGGAIALSTVTGGGLFQTLVSGAVLSHTFLVIGTVFSLLAACMKASAVCMDTASAANGPADILAAVLVAILIKHRLPRLPQ